MALRSLTDVLLGKSQQQRLGPTGGRASVFSGLFNCITVLLYYYYYVCVFVCVFVCVCVHVTVAGVRRIAARGPEPVPRAKSDPFSSASPKSKVAGVAAIFFKGLVYFHFNKS